MNEPRRKILILRNGFDLDLGQDWRQIDQRLRQIIHFNYVHSDHLKSGAAKWPLWPILRLL